VALARLVFRISFYSYNEKRLELTLRTSARREVFIVETVEIKLSRYNVVLDCYDNRFVLSVDTDVIRLFR
jgi:hypothetical protein